MKAKNNFYRLAVGIMAVWLLIVSCNTFSLVAVGETRTDTQAVELGSADEVEVQVKMIAGELSLRGGADNLMDAAFKYNVKDWQPRVQYQESGSQGELLVEHRNEDKRFPRGEVVNEWNLSFNDQVPIDMEIQLIASESNIDLHSLNLTNLRIEVPAGNLDIDLSGNLDHDLSAAIHGGVGQLTVKLPEEMGVRVSADTGIVDLTTTRLRKEGAYYVNQTYGSAPHTLYLNISTGLGEIKLISQ